MAERPERIAEEDLCRLIINSGGFTVRDIDADEEPFLYSSGFRGPGYIDIKGRVGWKDVFEILTQQAALALLEEGARFDFVAANATGGMVPGFRVRQHLEEFTGRNIPYVYVRNTRKIGGHQEYVTGLKSNPNILPGSIPLIYEELVNFAETTCNSKLVLQKDGYVAVDAGTILDYKNPKAQERLLKENLRLISIVRLPVLIALAEGFPGFSRRAIEDYRNFLINPVQWNIDRGYPLPQKQND